MLVMPPAAASNVGVVGAGLAALRGEVQGAGTVLNNRGPSLRSSGTVSQVAVGSQASLIA